MALSHLTLSDPEGQSHTDCFEVLSPKGAELGHMLLLNVNGIPYMGSRIASTNLTLSDLERSKSFSLAYWIVGDLYIIHICTDNI